MKILIVGASSYVGARIYYDLRDKYEVIGTCFHNRLSSSFLNLNITKEKEVIALFKKTKPNIIIHVANFLSLKNANNNRDKFIQLNDKGTNNVVSAANSINAKVVFISSQAANNLSDIYGQLKAKSEKMVKDTKAGYLILRPSLIVGYSPNTINPRPFNRILKCLDDQTVTGEFDTSWKLKPTYLGHLSQIIVHVIQNNTWNKTIPVFINELTTQHQIALDILNQFGVKVNPIDQNIDRSPSEDDLSVFNTFSLSPKTYQEMITVIVREIRERDKFRLNS